MWVEISLSDLTLTIDGSHTLTGVWVEIADDHCSLVIFGHTLTGVWVEILSDSKIYNCSWVTPSRVCELKFCSSYSYIQQDFVTPSRVCELKSRLLRARGKVHRVTPSRVCELKLTVQGHNHRTLGHTLTGVWVEIAVMAAMRGMAESHPHGCVSWNISGQLFLAASSVTPSRVCELKFRSFS